MGLSEEEKIVSMHYTPAGWVRAERNYEEFVCRHGDEEEKAEELLQEVLGRLETTKEDLLTRVVYSLTWDYSASITGIYCDQWCGVLAQTGDGSFGTFIQCDAVEDGIAATWKAFADREVKEDEGSGEDRPVPGESG